MRRVFPQASDRRAGDNFGYSLAISSVEGFAVIGAPYGRIVDGMNFANKGGNSQGGAVYVFKREPENRDSAGILISAPYWNSTEDVKVGVARK